MEKELVCGMIVRLSDYIVSPLAMGTHENYECVKEGKTRLRLYEGLWGIPEPFVASMMDDVRLAEACRGAGMSDVSGLTRFERMAILSAARALEGAGISPEASNVLFIVATTKGNVGLLGGEDPSMPFDGHLLLTEAARKISGWFHNPNEPLVVCNACISGLSAQIEAVRMLESGRFDYVILVGADVLSPFVVSGFQSLKALSGRPCRPFDEDRNGLNLGEAAACIIYGKTDGQKNSGPASCWYAEDGVVRNDAYHISSPSKTAEGACRALKALCEDRDLSDLAFINVHGTATMFNDEAEAVALHRMGLDHIPACGLKGYYGHTMGASGVLETLIAMEAVDDCTVPATKGFEHTGVSHAVNLSDQHRVTSGTSFIKMMSGFGGCNAAMLFRRGSVASAGKAFPAVMHGKVTHTVHVTACEATVDGHQVEAGVQGLPMLKALYVAHVGDYPKFYKMDSLCKLGFVASELLLEAEGAERFVEREDRAVVMVGRCASSCADRTFQNTIQSSEGYYPSPSLFVYTLPNILTGEIAIRNKYHGETSYFVQDTPEYVMELMNQVLRCSGASSVVGGWIDMNDTMTSFEARLYIINKI